jgi:hypothetical protein
MTESASETAVVVRARCEQKVFPPYDDFHGTPNAMLWRRVSIETQRGVAAFEQTDYGHPGRLNPWEPRGVAAGLAPRLAQLRAVAEALAAVEG